MKRHPFVGLVGPSGSGKTTLIRAALHRLPERCTIVKSVTTRPRRGPEDDMSYEFVTREEIIKRHAAGYLVNFSEYAGNFYGFDRRVLDTALEQQIGLQALVESAIDPLRHAGYDLKLIRIIPEGTTNQRNQARVIADQERAQDSHVPDLVIDNRFSQGGLDEATNAFINYLKLLTQI